MSVNRGGLGLTCDQESCLATIWLATTVEPEARQWASFEGWAYLGGAHGDFCPRHA